MDTIKSLFEIILRTLGIMIKITFAVAFSAVKIILLLVFVSLKITFSLVKFAG